MYELPDPIPSRRGRNTHVADRLKDAASSYFLHKGFSCFHEIGVNSWGKLRADVLCLDLRAKIVLVEIKSSVADYSTDKKWRTYLEYSNRMYFCFSMPVYEKLKDRLKADLKGTGVGVLVLDPKSGYLEVKQTARYRKMAGKTKRDLVIRMAWRSGDSRRNKRRTRIFLTPPTPTPTKTPRGARQPEESL